MEHSFAAGHLMQVDGRLDSLALTEQHPVLASLVGSEDGNQIQNIENGRGNSTPTSNPKLDALWALAQAGEIEVSDLLSTL